MGLALPDDPYEGQHRICEHIVTAALSAQLSAEMAALYFQYHAITGTGIRFSTSARELGRQSATGLEVKETGSCGVFKLFIRQYLK